MRTRVTCIAATFAALFFAGFASAADYPTKPIRIIVPYPPGGGTDLSARIVAEALTPRLGQPVVIENKPGATGTIGSDLVSKSPADGYTLLWSSSDSMAMVPALRPTNPYKVPDGFTYVAQIATTGNTFAISAATPAKDLKEFIAYGKANPGKIRLGSTGIGGSSHMTQILFEKVTGMKMTNVPYKGIAPALTDMLGGHIELTMVTPITLVPHMGSDKLRVIAYSAASRHPMLPDVPTLAELGYPESTVTLWYGLMAPPNLPADIAQKLRTGIEALVKNPEIATGMRKAGLQVSPLYGEEFRQSVIKEHNQWKQLGEAEKIVLD
jgi:tripartite-type tricarboxylate transporter receptor subunit TctC